MSRLDTVVVGAGPYGISLGLHLKARGAAFKVFGPPMKTWLDTMPKGMDLKSEGYASTIHDPSGKDLATYCANLGLPFKPVAHPVPLDVFGNYGLDCYRRLGREADRRAVISVVHDGSGYRIGLEDGDEVRCRRVVVAAGISHFSHLPDQFQQNRSELITHSSAHSDMETFNGKELLIVGAGASAIDLAVLAAEAGAAVTLVCRNDIKWNVKRLDPRPLYERIRLPESCMGPGVRSCLYEKVPLGFKVLPAATRDKIAREFAGPSGGWTVHERFERSVSYLTHTQIGAVKEKGDRLAVELVSADGTKKSMEVNRLICATGYKTDVDRLKFIDESLLRKIARLHGSPLLDTHYQSTAPGLYFVGKASAVTFGPLMRFVCGTAYAAKRVSRHLTAA